jgi:hypothetical protein
LPALRRFLPWGAAWLLHITSPHRGAFLLPKRNYGFEKRQKELTKQRKKEEKAQRKLDRAKASAEADVPEQPASEGGPRVE